MNNARVAALLDGVRVVDLADGRGELCARMLADLGADVLRIEAPGGGRSACTPPFAPDGTSLASLYRNANKSVIVADLHDAGARRTLESLLAGADLLVESEDPGGLAAIHPDLAPAALVARHPHLVVTSISAFGQTGPYRDFAATDLVLQALGGTFYRAGSALRPPCAAPGSFASDMGGATAALAALLALLQAQRTGRGQHVDVSCLESLAHLTDWALPLWSLLRGDQQRAGAPLYPLFPCADGLVRLVLPMTVPAWATFLAWLDSPDLADIVVDTPTASPDIRARVGKVVAAAFADRTRDQITRAAMAAGVAVAPVLLPHEVLTNEHARSRGSGVELTLPDGGTGVAPAGFFSVDGTRAGIRTLAEPSRTGEWNPRQNVRSTHQNEGVGALPLAGVVVLDFGIGGVGPECGRLLAEWGADVIKVESAARPDFQRKVLGGDMNPTFASSSRSKRGLGVDLRTEAGRALLRRLLPRVDVVVENMATGTMAKLGLGWDELHARNPRLVMASSQLLGDRGALSHWKGYGPSARAIGGLTWLWEHEGVTAREGVSTIHPDHFAGRLLAIGAVAGLVARARTGQGCHVDLAQFEAVAVPLGDLLLAESLVPGSVGPVGNTSPLGAPWGAYRCRDDDGAEAWVAICVRDDRDWHALAQYVDDAGLAADAALATAAGRLACRSDLDRRIGAWTRTRDAADLMCALQAVGVPAGVLLHPRTQVADPHYRARGFVVPLEQPGSGSLLVDGPAFRGTALGHPVIAPAPLPGADTRRICMDLAGCRADEVDALIAAGVLDAG